MSHAITSWTMACAPEVEARLDALAAEATTVISSLTARSALRTLAAIGGYGRGEGGVEQVGNQLRPHNNVDLLLVTRGFSAARRARLAHSLDAALAPVAEHHNVPIDLGVIGEDTLRRARKQVLWYDVCHGHRVLAGDPTYLRSQTRLRARDLDSRDVRDLVVNRGTLLVINQLALADGYLDDAWRKRIIRHAMKSIVGYGDALLFVSGSYHWSYREKQRRIRTCLLASSRLRELYEQAIQFRFRPDYQRFADMDLHQWHRELVATLEPAHRTFVRAIHGRDIAWREYPPACLSHALALAMRSPRDWARCARHALAARGPLPVRGRTGAAYLFSSTRDRLAAVFPAACYGAGGDAPLALAQLGRGDQTARYRQYLACWANHGDVNIPDDVRALAGPTAANTVAAREDR